jgi:hypothetical protein
MLLFWVVDAPRGSLWEVVVGLWGRRAYVRPEHGAVFVVRLASCCGGMLSAASGCVDLLPEDVDS